MKPDIMLPEEKARQYKKDFDALVAEIQSGNEDAARQIRDYIHREVEGLKRTKLFPQEEDYDPEISGPTALVTAERSWYNLGDNVKNAADSLFQDIIKKIKLSNKAMRSKREFRRGLDWRASIARRLIQLWLEINLYRLRMISNFDSLLFVHDAEERDNIGDITYTKVKRQVQEYNNIIKSWDKNTRRIAHRRLFSPRFEDSDLFEDLSREFGPTEKLSSEEPGWARVAARARNDLFAESRDIELQVFKIQVFKIQVLKIIKFTYLVKKLREVWHLAKYTIWKYLTGYGINPNRMILVLIIFSLVIGGAYLGDDHISNCNGNVPPQSYFLYPILKLVGGQNGLSPCGNFTNNIDIVGFIVGYFLLGVITSSIVFTKKE